LSSDNKERKDAFVLIPATRSISLIQEQSMNKSLTLVPKELKMRTQQSGMALC
jgi:hypothetical protein